MSRQRLAAIVLAAAILTLPAGLAVAGGTINSVPDWHQPCLIGAPNGPDNGAAPAVGQACYKAWCVPSAAADIMGYWRDVKGCAGVADAAVYASGATIAWAPPAPVDWQDDSADASSIPLVPNVIPGGARGAGQDLGWYLNTNDQGDQSLPSAGGGYTFSGTKIADIQQGLTNYLSNAGYASAVVTESACNHLTGWAKIKAEIDAGRPIMGLFSHGAIIETGTAEYDWNPNPADYDSQTGEEWGDGKNGHAMTIVGYLDPGDAGNPWANMDTIIVQDNRRHNVGGVPEADNNLLQQKLKFYDTNLAQGVAPWTGYVAVDVPEPVALAMLAAGGAVLLRRRRRPR